MLKRALRIFTPPKYDSIEHTQKAGFLHYALLVTAGTCIALAILNAFEVTNLDIYLFLMGTICFLCVPLNQMGYYTPVATFVSTLLLLIITYSLTEGIGLQDAGLMVYPVYMVFTTYLLGKKTAIFTVVLSILSAALVYAIERMGRLNPAATYEAEKQLIVVFIFIVAAGALLWVVVDNWEKIVKNLRTTYDMTLSGWSRTLELRDHETEGHSRRVVELTVELAKRVGVQRGELEHIRHGALLHDIGKMAVPDSILLKPGKLTEQEWEVVRQHPVHARNLLKDIPYLKPALDIPYSHHERWDGSGYPQGTTGAEIPLPARVFAVVDVWDALISDRPYRNAWSETQARDYIREQAGKQFDPQVVSLFLELLGQTEINHTN